MVATLGTSITERHLRALSRQASEICLALDPDAAGQAAALRTAEVARSGLSDAAVPIPLASGLIRYASTSRAAVKVAVLPDGLDPDELILSDPARWQATIEAAQPLVEHAIQWLVGRQQPSTAADKAQAIEQLVPLLRDIPDPIQKGHYVELVAQLLHVPGKEIPRAMIACRLHEGQHCNRAV